MQGVSLAMPRSTRHVGFVNICAVGPEQPVGSVSCSMAAFSEAAVRCFGTLAETRRSSALELFPSCDHRIVTERFYYDPAQMKP